MAQQNIVTDPEAQMRKSRIGNIISLALVAAVVIITSIYIKFEYGEALMSFPNAAVWMAQNFYPNAASLQKLPNILAKLNETILMSVAATTTAAIVAYVMALLGSEVTKVNGFMASVVRLIASIFRNVPDIVWSMIFLFSFGMNVVTGFLALFFVTLGMLVRAFTETIDESSKHSVEALEASGANKLQLIGQAIIPDSIAGVISWILYAIENNVRSATLIGILTGSGIGHIFNLYYKSLDYNSCALVVICIMIVVLILEYISNTVRRSIL